MIRHTILGAGGVIANELARALRDYQVSIRLVSRNPVKINESDELVAADLRNPEQVMKALEDTDVAYLTVGLPYKLSIWQSEWPVIMNNTIRACEAQNVRLVFFDNIYMYDPAYLSHMTEETPVNPPSKKGKVRADIFKTMMSAVDSGRISGLVARAADFYGPQIDQKSILTEVVFKNLHQGKAANWFCSKTVKHSFTYTPDAGKAVAMLGNSNKAFGQVWHVPTAGNPPTGEEWVAQIAQELNARPRIQVVGKTLISILGLFNPMMRELKEMLYQYDRDYVFDSSKFEKEYNFKPAPVEEGIEEVVRLDFRKD